MLSNRACIRSSLLVLGLVVVALSGSGFAVADNPTQDDLSPASMGCGGVCLPCGFNWYAGEPIEPDGNYDHAHLSCDLTGNNCNCATAFVDPKGAESAAILVASGGADAIREALRRYPAAVSVNLERSAVQVRGCGDGIIAQAPLTRAAARAFAVEFASLGE